MLTETRIPDCSAMKLFNLSKRLGSEIDSQKTERDQYLSTVCMPYPPLLRVYINVLVAKVVSL